MTTLITISGTDGHQGPLPVFRDATDLPTIDITVPPLDPAALTDTLHRFHDALASVDRAVVVGFSVGGHLALLPWSREDLAVDVPAGTVDRVVACDPPAVLALPGDHPFRIDRVPAAPDTTILYPSIRRDQDRLDGPCRTVDIPYRPVPYDHDDPSTDQYRRMDRAHRFAGRDETVREVAAQVLPAADDRL